MAFRKFIFQRFIGKKISKKILDNIFFFSGISRLEYFSLMEQKDFESFIYQLNLRRGIGYDINRSEENEDWFIINKLTNLIRNSEKTVMFDIGANKGQYLNKLIKTFDKSIIYSFEPNPYSFQILEDKFGLNKNVNLYQKGISDFQGNFLFYTREGELDSELASFSKEVFLELHNFNDLKEIEVDVITIDCFCEERGIDYIDFLKIDVEGFENKVLIGAKRMIIEGKISVIQFEFNEMNVIHKICLMDFYKLLFGYDFFRIGQNELIPLGEYSVLNEIFSYQNIVAIKTSLKAK